MIVTRGIRLPSDAAAVAAMDRSFTAITRYELRRSTAVEASPGGVGALRVELVGPLTTAAVTKRYDMTPRDGGVVARRNGVIVGYAHVAYQEWNRRAEIGDFYVAADARRAGIGGALMAAVFRRARQTPARCLWLETQQMNGPAIAFYLRQGFTWCGFDDTLYDPAEDPSEVALYFSHPL